jgi:hypothetical protein
MATAACAGRREGSLLRVARNEQAAAKVGTFGGPGSGKSTTTALLAIVLSKTYQNSAPVAMHDTENGGDYLAPIFQVEGVPLLMRKSRAFADMVGVLEEAERAGCCALIVDSTTVVWNELLESYCHRLKIHRLDFHHWRDIKSEWRGWVDRYLNSSLHCLLTGRAGYEHESQEDAGRSPPPWRGTGRGTGATLRPARAGSGRPAREFGYESSLLIEMEAVRGPEASGHCAHVVKDRTRSLQGKTFHFRECRSYKPGGWRKVFDKFRPHFGFLNVGGVQHALELSTSAELFEENGGESLRRAQAKKIALEEIANLLGVVLWPGQDVESKRIRLAVLERLWGVRAWAAVEAMPLNEIERGLFRLLEYEKAGRGPEAAGRSTEEILAMLDACAGVANGSE